MVMRDKNIFTQTGHLSRREILQILGAGATLPFVSPVSAVVASLISSAALEANAQSDAGPRNYVFIYLESGPPRWYFDLALHPYKGPETVVRNGGVNNCFVGGQPAYLAKPFSAAGQTVNMPILWGANLPRPNGQAAAPMAGLLENMLIVRGYDMQSDGHVNNRIKQMLPLTGAASLNGLVADGSTKPLPAVTVAGGVMDDAYTSNQGVGQLKWFPEDAARNPLQQFLDPFQYEDAIKQSPLYAKRQNLNEVMEAALGKMKKAAEARAPGSGGLFRDRESARGLLLKAFGDLPGIYGGLVGKYRAIIAGCMALDIPGVNDQPVATAGIAAQMRQGVNLLDPSGNPKVYEQADLRTILKADTMLTNLAEGFAVAEFMIAEGLGAAVQLSCNQPANLLQVAGGAQVNVLHQSDEHAAGTALSTLIWSYGYRGIAACIYELVQVLKAKGQWNNTVIHLANEFSRSARTDGSGADHGWEGNVMSLWSGAIKAPLVIGNIRANASDATKDIPAYAGTWGGAANIDHDKTIGHLNIGHVSSTVATLLNVERPMKNFASLITADDSGIKSVVEEAKNV